MVKRVVRMSIIITLIGILSTTFYLMIRQQHETLEFEDPALEEAIRNVLNIPPTDSLTRRQVETITILDIPNAGIESLEGLQAFTALRILNLENNQIKDVTPLSSLNNLASLNLRNNEITDLSAIKLESLSHLNSLKELNLRHNVYRPYEDNPSFNIRLTDITMLNQFTQLESLILRDNNIQDISPLASLVNLIYLDISENPILEDGLSSLSNLNRLEYLNLRETNIRDITVLTSFPMLRYLNLHSNTEINSFAPLAFLNNLNNLILRNVPLGDDISYLSGMTKLVRLNLRNSNITDVTVIASLIAQGALQDNPSLGQYAELDLRDNPIPIVDGAALDGYNPLKDYWQNITYRYPYLLPVDPTREVIINELMSSNGDTIIDYDGDYSDWIELYNPTNEPVNLSGYYLSDNMDNPFRWQFPNNTVIQPGEFLLIWASGKNKVAANGELHTNFGISRSGEPLILTAPDRITLVDQVIPISVPRNVSYGRQPDGSDYWVFFDRNNITPNSSNNNATPYELPDWLDPTTDYQEDDDLHLFNSLSFSIDLPEKNRLRKLIA